MRTKPLVQIDVCLGGEFKQIDEVASQAQAEIGEVGEEVTATAFDTIIEQMGAVEPDAVVAGACFQSSGGRKRQVSPKLMALIGCCGSKNSAWNTVQKYLRRLAGTGVNAEFST